MEGKVIDGSVKFEEGSLVVQGSLDPNKDGEKVLELGVKVHSKEAVEEIFSRAQGGTAQLIAFEPSFGGTSVGIKFALDTDKDGQKVLEVDLKTSLLEITDEVLDAIAAAKGKKLVSA